MATQQISSAAHADACRRWWLDASGVSAIEYALLAALIVVVILGALTATNGAIVAMYTAWTDAVIAALLGP
jgi:Flp pilus assembly pilin Flp